MTRSRKQGKTSASNGGAPERERPASVRSSLRIVGGEFRGRTLDWTGDPITRPMKDNIREAVFNLVGGWIPGKNVFDLFAGSGAIGLEAVSRGAVHATLIERHFPSAKIIRSNIERLQIADRCSVVTADTFYWGRQFLSKPDEFPGEPWAVFCSPPYELYVSRKQELLTLIQQLKIASPPDSLFVVESDERFDPAELPEASQWRVREYAPARISVIRPAGANR